MTSICFNVNFVFDPSSTTGGEPLYLVFWTDWQSRHSQFGGENIHSICSLRCVANTLFESERKTVRMGRIETKKKKRNQHFASTLYQTLTMGNNPG